MVTKLYIRTNDKQNLILLNFSVPTPTAVRVMSKLNAIFAQYCDMLYCTRFEGIH